MTAVGVSSRLGNGHHHGVDVMTESRAGWTVAGVSAGFVGLWLVTGGLGDLGHHGFADFIQTRTSSSRWPFRLPAL